ncbi:hypothetical protein J6590_074580 [Homalodisca vitripennis]|nr:hypothetical protein J6590_074580 [Homalodisca vitripennis]
MDMDLHYQERMSIKIRAFHIWFSPELKSMISRKKLLHKRYKQSLDDRLYYQFCGLRAACGRITRKCYSAYIQSIDSSQTEHWRLLEFCKFFYEDFITAFQNAS